MFIGRKEELKQLESIYSSDHSNLLVLYGREGIGKTALALNFSEGRDHSYYQSVMVSEAEQERRLEDMFAGSLNLSGTLKNNDLASETSEDSGKGGDSGKKILIIDEFHYAMNQQLMASLLSLVSHEEKYGKYMILLLSSSINWVENSMILEYKEFAKAITGIIKLKELSFADTVSWFPKVSASDCVVIRALLGGVPKYLRLWQENRRIRENMINLFFSPDSVLKNEAEYQLKLELRELGAYNTILTALASGRIKLNDIYEYTGFNRAKISVYIKNLIEMDIVEKVYSINVRNSENTKKGLYRIKDNFINFYYAYVFPNVSKIETGEGRSVYNEFVVPDFDRFMRTAFADVCREYLDIMAKYRKLGKNYNEWHYWFGKNGILDVIGMDPEENILVATCVYSDKKTDVNQYEEMKELIAQAGIKPSKLCIFSKTGFTPELTKEAKNDSVMIVSLNDF
ncbi:MAG: ATP-binding protein [Lachnospiraceae bacterium]|nr:ATP-binding protein [Lachnospiraceae bacterium]